MAMARPMDPVLKVKLRIQKLPLWELTSRRSGYSQTTKLWLYPELNYSSCVDDCMPASGEEQLEYYLDMIREVRPEYWERDAVPIYWTVYDMARRSALDHSHDHGRPQGNARLATRRNRRPYP
jgi:hypothetical protein